MHAFRRVGIHGDHQILVNILRHEGYKGRDDLAQRHQHVVQGDKGGFLGLVHALAPETLTAAAHIPVAQVVHHVGDGPGGLGNVIIAQVVVHVPDGAVQTAQDPLVHQGQTDLVHGVILGVEVVDIGVQHEERVGVLQGGHELALAFVDGLVAEAAGQPGSAGRVEIPADRVRALLIQHRPRIDHVAQMLGHLAALRVLHVTHHDAVFKGRAVEQQGGNGFQRVEPAPGLVDGFGNEVGREALFEDILVFEGIVPLGEGHGSGIVPAVDDVGDAGHGLAAFRALDLDGVHIGAVQLQIVRHGADGHFLQFLTAADDVDMALFATPDGQGRAPVAFTAQAPVMDVFQPHAHAAFLDVVWQPVDGAVIGHQLIPHGGHLDVPRGAGVVQKGRIAAPAERIIVSEGHGGEQQSPLLQIVQHQLVRVLDEHARPLGVGGHAALGVHEVHEGDVVLPTDAVIVLTKGGSDMNDAGTVGHGDVIIADHTPGGLIQFAHGEVEQGLVFHALQVDTGHFRVILHFLAAENGGDQRLAHDVMFALHRDAAIGIMGIDAQRQVAGQRPGRGGPCQKVSVLALDLEQHERGGFLHILVALRHFVAGQGGAAAGAVGRDLVAQIQQTLFINFLQAPPLGLDIIVLVGDIGMLHIRPVADPVRHFFPFMLVFPDAFLALLDEGLNTVGLDLRLAVQPQLLFHFQLHRQAVGVPAGLAQHILALHGLETRDQVLNGAGLNMADMGAAVSRRRAVKERKAFRAVPAVEALFDDALFLPQAERFFFALHKLHVRWNLAIHVGDASLVKNGE